MHAADPLPHAEAAAPQQFEQLSFDEEEHIDFLETRIQLAKQAGVRLDGQKHMGKWRIDLPGRLAIRIVST